MISRTVQILNGLSTCAKDHDAHLSSIYQQKYMMKIQ